MKKKLLVLCCLLMGGVVCIGLFIASMAKPPATDYADQWDDSRTHRMDGRDRKTNPSSRRMAVGDTMSPRRTTSPRKTRSVRDFFAPIDAIDSPDYDFEALIRQAQESLSYSSYIPFLMRLVDKKGDLIPTELLAALMSDSSIHGYGNTEICPESGEPKSEYCKKHVRMSINTHFPERWLELGSILAKDESDFRDYESSYIVGILLKRGYASAVKDINLYDDVSGQLTMIGSMNAAIDPTRFPNLKEGEYEEMLVNWIAEVEKFEKRVIASQLDESDDFGEGLSRIDLIRLTGAIDNARELLDNFKKSDGGENP